MMVIKNLRYQISERKIQEYLAMLLINAKRGDLRMGMALGRAGERKGWELVHLGW